MDNKFDTFRQRYALKSLGDFLSPMASSIILITIYLLLEAPIEDVLNKYWITSVIVRIQSDSVVVVLLFVLALFQASYQYRSRNFSIRPYEIFMLFFYVKYRFFDAIWTFHPTSSFLKFFDLIPTFLFVPKILAFLSFYNDFEVTNNKVGIIDPDIPLGESNPKDELNRAKFADELVTVLKNTKPSERALVIGINGSWGSGKTSLQFLIERSLRTDENREQFYLINFNPWLHSQSASLPVSYLRLIKDFVKVDQYLISKSISKYADKFITGTENLIFNTQFFADLTHKPSLEEELQAVRLRLKHLKKTLLVIIDDLDRLAGEELIEVLRLVRLVGDFPNTIYIILYDKEYVRKVISENINDHNSTIYLDKIIQVEYTIPESDLDNLKQLLLNHLSNAIQKAIPESKTFWSKEEINTILKIEQFNYFIQHLRDIKRFSNNFLLRYKSIYHEVNFKQFMLLELMRYRHPELANIIFNNKDIFLAQFDSNTSFGRPDIPVNNEFWTRVVPNENVRILLREMSNYRSELRSISESSFFPHYFTLTLLDNFISEAEFTSYANKKLDDSIASKYIEWSRQSRNILLYRFRNYESFPSIDSFINYVDHLGFVQNSIIKDEVISGSSSTSWTELPKIFINNYLKLRAGTQLDTKMLYEETSKYLFTSGKHTSDSLRNIFRNNTVFSVSGSFNDSPLAHGWKEASNHSVDNLRSIFIPLSDSTIGNFITFNAPFQFRFDFTFENAPVYLRNSKIQLKTYDQDWAFYIIINSSRNNRYVLQYFRVLDQGQPIEKVSDNEFTVGLTPAVIENQWKVFEINLDELFNRSFAADGYTLQSVIGIAIRGKVGFGVFQLS